MAMQETKTRVLNKAKTHTDWEDGLGCSFKEDTGTTHAWCQLTDQTKA